MCLLVAIFRCCANSRPDANVKTLVKILAYRKVNTFLTCLLATDPTDWMNVRHDAAALTAKVSLWVLKHTLALLLSRRQSSGRGKVLDVVLTADNPPTHTLTHTHTETTLCHLSTHYSSSPYWLHFSHLSQVSLRQSQISCSFHYGLLPPLKTALSSSVVWHSCSMSNKHSRNFWKHVNDSGLIINTAILTTLASLSCSFPHNPQQSISLTFVFSMYLCQLKAIVA